MANIKITKDIAPLFNLTVDALLAHIDKMHNGEVEFDIKVLNTAHTLLKDHGVQCVIEEGTPAGKLKDKLKEVELEDSQSTASNVVPNPFPPRKTTKNITL